jgi:hypothetical protein
MVAPSHQVKILDRIPMSRALALFTADAKHVHERKRQALRLSPEPFRHSGHICPLQHIDCMLDTAHRPHHAALRERRLKALVLATTLGRVPHA